MPRVVVRNFSVSLDGFGAGQNQSLEDPVGVGGRRLHQWIFESKAGRAMLGLDGGADGVNSDYMARRGEGTGATIMGRNMFGPVRGEWPTPLWNGWWGDEPPFDHDVFVLTNHARPSVVTANNTRFHFVTEGPESALDQAREAAGDLDVLIAGGVQTIRQYVARNEVDELNLVIVPTYLGEGESLYDGLTGQLAAYDEVTITQGEGVSHVRLSR